MDLARSPSADSRRHLVSRWLALTAASYALCHHLGLLPNGLGPAVDGSSIADWLDLLVPWLVLGPAAMTLRLSSAEAAVWTTFGVGAVAYASGHGIHLAANSIGNVEPSPTAHLWDETVSHYVWFVGVALVFAALTSSMSGRPRPGPGAWLLGLAVATTWATNAVGGQTIPLGVAVGIVATGYGLRHRDDLRVVLVTFGPTTLGLLAWVWR